MKLKAKKIVEAIEEASKITGKTFLVGGIKAGRHMIAETHMFAKSTQKRILLEKDGSFTLE